MGEPTVAAGYTGALLAFAVSRGADRRTLLDRSGIAPEHLAQPDNRISRARCMALMEASIDLCGEPALALKFGEAVRTEDLSIVWLIAAAAETVGEALRQWNRYARLVRDDDDGAAADLLELVRDGDGVWLELRSSAGVDDIRLVEASFAKLVCDVRRTFGAQPAGRRFPRAVRFTHPQPGYLAEYDRIFGAPLAFDSDRNALMIDEAFLQIRLPPSNRYVFGMLSERAEALLRSLDDSKSIRGRIESLLMPVLHTGEVDMAATAARLGLTRQTLYRRLKAEGVRFDDVLDELRHRMALHYLAGQRVSVNETAYLVGFSEPAAFSRAFKRWTGSPPSSVRKRAQPAPRRTAALAVAPGLVGD